MSSVRDLMFISIILLVVGIALFSVVKVSHIINANLLANPTMNSSIEAQRVLGSADRVIDATDYIYLAALIGFFLGIIVLGWFMSAHPVMSVIYFILVILFTFVSTILQYVWVEYATSDEMVLTILNLPITYFILSHLAYFVAVFGLVGILVMFAKPTISEGNYG